MLINGADLPEKFLCVNLLMLVCDNLVMAVLVKQPVFLMVLSTI